jgi:hypothetical protein
LEHSQVVQLFVAIFVCQSKEFQRMQQLELACALCIKMNVAPVIGQGLSGWLLCR